MPGREELVEYLQKLAEGPIRRTPIDPHRLGWATGLEFEEAKAEEQLFYCFPPYPARLDGKNYMEGQIITIKFDDNLVSLWDMAEGKGNILYDRVVKNRNNGTIYGATWVVDPELGNCLSFDGVDDYVNLGIPTTLYQGLAEITLEFEVFLEQFQEQGSVNWHNYVPYGVHLRGDGKVAWVSEHSDGSQWLPTDTPLSTGRWQHIAITYKVGTIDLKAFLNGIEVGIQQPYRFGSLTPPTYPFYIGTRWVNFEHFFGLISRVRIYNRALSADIIAKHAQRNYWNQDYVWG